MVKESLIYSSDIVGIQYIPMHRSWGMRIFVWQNIYYNFCCPTHRFRWHKRRRVLITALIFLYIRFIKHTAQSSLFRGSNMYDICRYDINDDGDDDDKKTKLNHVADQVKNVNPIIPEENLVGSHHKVRPGVYMMTSSNGNIFRVTGLLCRELIGHRWIPHIKASDGCAKNPEAVDLRRHRVNCLAVMLDNMFSIIAQVLCWQFQAIVNLLFPLL